MTSNNDRPQGSADGKVADAAPRNWVDARAPRWSRPYLRLSRADRPIGGWLLLIPCWWGLALAIAADPAGPRLFDLWIAAGCAIGAFLMRGAGCTWNDITDRHIDAQVARTRSRPLPSGAISTMQAFVWLGVQSLIAFAILLTFNRFTIVLGVASLITVAIYPFAKRFTWWPQAFLGMAFSWGALLGWAAHAGSLSIAPLILYAAGIAWTLFYDTIYAHQDTQDDALIGVKSTARLFGDKTPRWLFAFFALSVSLIGIAVLSATLSPPQPIATLLGLAAAWAFGWHLTWQMRRFDAHNPATCWRLFLSNRDAGLISVGFLALAALI